MSSSSCNFRIVNCWSKAGIGTSIVLAYEHPKNGPKIVLDLGATPAFDHAIHASVVLLTHGHVDHVGAIFSHARAHKMSCGGSVPTYYLPKQILPLVQKAKEAMMALDAFGGRDGGILEMNLVGVAPGEELVLPLKKNLDGKEVVVRIFRTSHGGCPSVGYAISTRLRQKLLKAEYRGLPGEALRDLARSGVELKEELIKEDFDVAYTGDTTVEALVDNPQLWSRCHTIFCEATFLDATDTSRTMARDRGHMHVDDVVQVLQLSSNQRVVLMHISDRYAAQQALDYLVEAIPSQIVDRVEVAVLSLNGGLQFQDLARSGLVALSAYTKQLNPKQINLPDDKKQP